MILLIDNYDSFSYNLYQLLGSITPDINVIRNNEMKPQEIEKISPEAIIISPGPGKPKNAGYCEKTIEYFTGKLPILGICLGHQAICEVFGTKITYAPKIMHGKTSDIILNSDCKIFKNLPQKIKVARYHSLIADRNNFSKDLDITAHTDDDIIMAVKHKKYDIFGLQFHPESILTPCGKIIAENFMEIIKK